ncbi:MAG: helix-hairpin-helix domain-containing protein [Bacillota bacterium]|nr:helix-hairpin-helix domain-containing protein [Bacillota bacterium]
MGWPVLFLLPAILALAGAGCGPRAPGVSLGRQPPAASTAPLRFEVLPRDAGTGASGASGLGGAAQGDAAGSQSGPGADPDAGFLEYVHVHVAGAVARAGVYRLVAGARACDALALAGGETAQAYLAAVNLASLLSDGQQLYIPSQAEVRASGSAIWPGGLPAGGVAGAGSGVAAIPGPLDINSASSKALEDLPGIGPVLAARIVAYRAANGRYSTVDDLLKVSGIGPARLADIRDRITVR